MPPRYHAPFRHFVKKQRRPLQLAMEDAVGDICADPGMGDVKAGDLKDLRVYKFRFQSQEYLIAYRPLAGGGINGNTEKIELVMIDFYQIGTHENFYAALKTYLKTRGSS